jgi:hypothetical protein
MTTLHQKRRLQAYLLPAFKVQITNHLSAAPASPGYTLLNGMLAHQVS